MKRAYAFMQVRLPAMRKVAAFGLILYAFMHMQACAMKHVVIKCRHEHHGKRK